MIAEQRRNKIHEWVRNEGTVTFNELERRLDVSLMTIRRDIDKLHEKGVIERIRGGAVFPPSDFNIQEAFEAKKALHSSLKDRIARYAVRNFVADNNILCLEGGTTVFHMMKYLNMPNLNVITNGLFNLNEAASFSDTMDIMCCGGNLKRELFTFVGPHTEAFFKSIRSHIAFIGADGITLENGLMELDALEVQAKRAMMSCANQSILLLDGSKFGKISVMPAIPLDDIDVLITDSSAPEDMVESLRQTAIDVHVVDETC